MTSDFTPGARRMVEEYLGRELRDEDLQTVPSLNDLSQQQRAVFEFLAQKHRLAAWLFVQGVVQDALSSETLPVIDLIRTRHGL